MSSDRLGARRFRFDGPHPTFSGGVGASSLSVGKTGSMGVGDSHLNRQDSRPFERGGTRSTPLDSAIARTRDFLIGQQHAEGYWVAELEGDTILESEYILLLAYLGQGQSETAKLAANYLRRQQRPEGGWAIYPGGPLEISASVKSYWTLKIVGDDPAAEHMVRAKEAIRAAGGAEKVNSFTRYYMALLGIISYDQCPAVPPELILLPPWMPLNIYEMSAWSRTIVVPLSLLWAFRPAFKLPAGQGIDELFLNSPEKLPLTMGASGQLDAMKTKSWIPWSSLFRWVDRGIKLVEKVGFKPLRAEAIRRCTAWLEARFEDSDGLGAIFPPIIWSVIAMKCLGHADDSPEVQRHLLELEKLTIREGDSIRLEPCKSPVWDTAIATLALREAGVTPDERPVRRAIQWLLSKECRTPGDWTLRAPADVEPSGWFFEFRNAFYPDVDDTCMVLIALARSLPEQDRAGWRADLLLPATSGAGKKAAEPGVVLTRTQSDPLSVLGDLERMEPMLSAMRRGARWIMAMQNADGGWGAFDRDNTREIFTRVPFADHNAMIDPSTADLTARMLEMFADLGMTGDHPVARRALAFVWNEQEHDGAWFGRWGVNYLYGTWQTLVGLAAIGVPVDDPRMRKGAEWLKSVQQPGGGWGETPATYDDPSLRGQGTPTASQTAWAIMGLIAAGEANSDAAQKGVAWLLAHQGLDGTWDEAPWTGTGFPRVFYLKYHYYRIYWPLMALARMARATQGKGL